MSLSGEQMESYEKKPKQLEVEVDPVSIDVHGVMTITIPFDMYNDLIEIRGRYYEIKDGDEENKTFMEEYKELLVIKGKYEELTAMFDAQFSEVPEPVVEHKVQLLSKEEYPVNEHTKACVGPDDNGNGCCRGV